MEISCFMQNELLTSCPVWMFLFFDVRVDVWVFERVSVFTVTSTSVATCACLQCKISGLASLMGCKGACQTLQIT